MKLNKRKLLKCLKKLVLKLKAWGGAVMVYDEKKDALLCAASVNIPKDWAEIENPMGSSSLNEESFTYASIIKRNDLNLESLLGTESKHTITAVLIGPIQKGKKILGTIEILHDEQGKEFTHRDEKLLKEESFSFADCFYTKSK